MSYFTPPEIAIQFCKSAQVKNRLSSQKMLIYSILGGAFIALGGLLSLVVVGGMPTVSAAYPGLAKLVFGAMFPLGLMLVVLGGAELFTSDCAVIPFAIFNQQLKSNVLFRIWCISYIGIFLAALLACIRCSQMGSLRHGISVEGCTTTRQCVFAKNSGHFGAIF